MDDVIFNCPQCQQELAVDGSAAGSEIECPSCGQTITIPQAQPRAQAESPADAEAGSGEGAAAGSGVVKNPILTSAAAKEEKHYKVPHHEKAVAALIEKPLPTLDVSAKEGVSLMIKTFKRSDTVEVGKDHFDEVVNKFLAKVGEANVVNINPISYAHQDLASHSWINDFGVLIVYKG